MRGRLFQRFEERVEGIRGELMDLVNDVDLVAPARRRVLHVLPERADIVDAAVRRGVDLDEVDRLGIGAHDAGAAGLRVLPLAAQERPCQQAGSRRLADTAGPREKVRVRDAAGRERVLEGARDRVLAHHGLERLRAPLAREDLVATHARPRKRE